MCPSFFRQSSVAEAINAAFCIASFSTICLANSLILVFSTETEEGQSV